MSLLLVGKALCSLSDSVFNGDLSTTEEEKRDSHRCSLFLQPAFRGSLSFQLLPVLGGTSGSSLGVFRKRNKILAVHIPGFIKNWEHWEEEELCFSSSVKTVKCKTSI